METDKLTNENSYLHGHVKSESVTAEIWVESVSLQPFTQEEWTPHYEQRLNMMRKGSVRIRAVNSAGEPIPNATISIVQNRLGLSFGCAVESSILEDKNSKTGSLRHSP
ncbi:hypothetical protein F2Q70_00043903 [Brassica cretica]|uniref:Uncharacterized protein n=3 Tax=Brassica TaxID=3705 RepID=A0A8S9KFV0_BRACR|nr:hypothetical protein F2Q70_00043903 [Brassica cretica]KAF2607402.1 hypothetical protein F2Q68_00044916 [Brassica cretica]KAF3516756.1 hypothetical protein DY000_02061403 [Brassica cretica]KAG2252061.1 hypothetical protein Bca52824_082197 [Brassica carinata]